MNDADARVLREAWSCSPPETPPRVVAERFAANGTLAGLSIPSTLDRGALEAIARSHVEHAHGTCVLDLVVAHPACDAALLELVLELGAGSSQVANTVATSGKATVEQLRALHDSDVPSVREHAELALLEHELRGASPETFAEVLHRYRDHETLGYAVCHRLATHPETPQAVLRQLASSRDAIGELARDRLSASARNAAHRQPAPVEVVMKPIGVLDEQRFLIDTLLTTSGTIVKVRYPALDLAHTGSPKQQRLLMQRLRADVARQLLTNPRLLQERHRWSRAVDPRHVALIESTPTLGCNEIESMLRQETGEMLYLVTTLALMRGCEIWPILSARPDALADPALRALLPPQQSS
jgi:hypothetical protein